MIEKLKQLYAEIPQMQCKPGCTKCCGFIPWSEFEYNQLEQQKEIRFLCVYPHKGRCSIYDQRPFICRLFGTIEPPHIMSCPEGCAPAFPLTADQASRLLARYRQLLKDDPWLNSLKKVLEK